MKIAKYTDNLYASEVYRELERQEAKKGFFKPTEAQVKTASDQAKKVQEQVNRPLSTKPSDDLIQDVARLAFAMRRKGYVSYAEDLEKNLIMYKQAESALYDLGIEKSTDLIDFSHRDGDVNIIDGSGELGEIETIQSIADKILAVTRKQPTGKLPGNSKMAELASWIVKSAADEDADPEAQRAMIAKLQPIYKTIVDKLNFPSMDESSFDFSKVDFWSNKDAITPYVNASIAANVPVKDGTTSVENAVTEHKLIVSLLGEGTDINDPGAWSKMIANRIISDNAGLVKLATKYGVNPKIFTQYSVVDWSGTQYPTIEQMTQYYNNWDWKAPAVKAAIIQYSGAEKQNANGLLMLSISDDGNVVTGITAQPNTTNIDKIASEMLKGYMQKYQDPAWGKDNSIFNAVNAYLQALPEKIAGQIRAVAQTVKSTVNSIQKNVVDEFGDVTDAASSIIPTSEDAVKKVFDETNPSSDYSLLKAAASVAGKADIVGIFTKWFDEFKAVLDKADTDINSLSSSGGRVTDISGVLGKINKIRANYISFRKDTSAPRDSDEANTAVENVKTINKIQNILESVPRKGKPQKPVDALAKKLKDSGWKGGFEELTKDVDTYLEQSAKDLEAAKAKYPKTGGKTEETK